MVNKLRKRINNLKNLFEARNDMFIKKSELIKDCFRIILNGEPYRIINEELKSFGKNNSNKTFYIIRIYCCVVCH